MSDHILIVEDDPDGQALVSHVVRHLRIPYEVVGDAEQALKNLSVHADAFKAVIIDLALPGKDGWELMTDIRKNPDTSHLICIAVTAFHTSKLRGDALKAGFDAYFPKPLDAAEFARELNLIL